MRLPILVALSALFLSPTSSLAQAAQAAPPAPPDRAAILSAAQRIVEKAR